jgi:uncharacterized metal-binding protein
MPSGRTHDAITFLLAVPSGIAGFVLTHSVVSGSVICIAFLFGGLMFGPDLDTISRQYSRWSLLKFLWFPYRHFFKHRSRFSHGLIFGALIRVIYFMGVLTTCAFVAACVLAGYSGGKVPDVSEVMRIWRSIGGFVTARFGEHFMLNVFIGLWLGAASHTLTDVAGSFIKTGRITKLL